MADWWESFYGTSEWASLREMLEQRVVKRSVSNKIYYAVDVPGFDGSVTASWSDYPWYDEDQCRCSTANEFLKAYACNEQKRQRIRASLSSQGTSSPN